MVNAMQNFEWDSANQILSMCVVEQLWGKFWRYNMWSNSGLFRKMIVAFKLKYIPDEAQVSSTCRKKKQTKHIGRGINTSIV